jgi:hypothetical protein
VKQARRRPASRPGLSGSFSVWNVGYDVTPDLTLAVLQEWNVYSFSGARGELRTEEGTIGPMFNWRDLSRWGITINGGVQVDCYHTPGLSEGIYVTSYIDGEYDAPCQRRDHCVSGHLD